MNNLNVLIIFIITFFNIIRLHGNKVDEDLTKLKRIMDVFKTDEDFIKRKVFVEKKEVSINDYYDSADQFKSEVDKPNMYYVFHIINIALSCEYSEITYHYIKHIDQYFSPQIAENESWYKLRKLNDSFAQFHLKHIPYISIHTKSMILSLASLMEFTRNTVYKYHDILITLLSWYAFLNQFINKRHEDKKNYDKRILQLESIMITNFQTKQRLERFLVKHCHRVDDLKKFITEVDENIKMDWIEFALMKNRKLEKLSDPIHEDMTKKYVINSVDTDYTNLYKLLMKQLNHKALVVKWKDEMVDIKQIFTVDVKTTYNIYTIIKFECLLHEILQETITLHEIKVLREIMVSEKEEDILNRERDCNVLVHEINKYLKKKNLDNFYKKPIDFVRFLNNNKNTISNICLLMSSEENKTIINDKIDGLQNKLKHVSKFFDKANFGKFLESLSELVISVKLHPLILNSLWERYRVYDFTEVWLYGSGYQYLYNQYNKASMNNLLCIKTKVPLNSLRNMEDQMNESIQNKNKKKCFYNFNERYNEVITQIAEIAVNDHTTYSDNWKILLLTLMHNKDTIDLFDTKKQDTFYAAEIEYYIRTFIYTMINYLSEIQFVQCSCDMFSSLDKIGSCSESAANPRKNWEKTISNLDDIKTAKELNGLIIYQKQLKNTTDRVKKLLEIYNHQIKFTMYWDGMKKDLDEVLDNYKKYTFDVQDAFNYTNFFIKWVIAIPYVKLMQLLKKATQDNIKYIINENFTDLKTSLNNFLKIDFLERSLIKCYLSDFNAAFELIIRGNKAEALNMYNELLGKFRFINVVSIPEHPGGFTNFISEFAIVIRKLMTVFDVQGD